jgi:hypothetical protein
MKTVFLRTLEIEAKEAGLLEAIRTPNKARGRQRFEVNSAGFANVPRSPFAYWISDDVRGLFVNLPPLGDSLSAQIGASTKADFRFLRAWWEESTQRGESPWLPFAKGGAYAPFYADVYLLIAWAPDPREIDAVICARYPYLNDNSAWVLHPESSYGHPGLTWSRRTKTNLSLRVLPAGCVFSDKGPAAFSEDGNSRDLLASLAVGMSSTFRALVEVQLAAADAKPGGAAHSYEIGIIQSTPMPELGDHDRSNLADLARRAWSLRRSLDAHVEVSHAFVLPALLQVDGLTLAVRCDAWADRVSTTDAELKAIQSAIDARCFELYGIANVDREVMERGFGTTQSTALEHVPDQADDDTDDDEPDPTPVAASHLAAEVVSWAVGVAFGRFDVRLALATRMPPPEPDPFDAMPGCSPGMLTDDSGAPVRTVPASYPLETATLLVDDRGHSLDISDRVRRVFEVVFGVNADEWWSDVGRALGAKRGEPGAWLTKGFFDYHLKMHSRSRRKAPVFWPIGTRSGSYVVWLYAPHVSADSLYQALHDVVMPKLALEERELTRLRQDAGVTPSLSERKAMDAQEKMVGELTQLVGDLTAVAPLWSPDLNDGIVVVLAPLWRLFAHHKPWSKELRTRWDGLVAGDYDWAQLAMYLWPERVVRKCAEDRSLAIAHGLEAVFWVQDDANPDTWHPRQTPTVAMAQLIADRTKPATTAALEDAVR